MKSTPIHQVEVCNGYNAQYFYGCLQLAETDKIQLHPKPSCRKCMAPGDFSFVTLTIAFMMPQGEVLIGGGDMVV
jgi:hypothetical protein